jgi:hypothetical protein
MKKLFVSALALAALTGVAVAGERDHDFRLPNPSYGESDTVRSSAPDVLINRYTVEQSAVKLLSQLDANRLDEKNGSKG